MTTRFDEDDDPGFGSIDPTTPGHDPDDPLLVLLGPAPAYLGAPPGRYEEIRRTAVRRRRIRTAAGVGMVCAVAGLIALPLNLTTSHSPRAPTVPQAPPISTSSSTPPADRSPTAATPQPSDDASTDPKTPALTTPSQTPTDESPVATAAPTTNPTTAEIGPAASVAGTTATPDGTVAP
ncbi:hypothetical protein ACIRJM_19410 [Streptomyces sp. NPDC102405]|uniref:hypothetical protein n=1 Tax=Streptomyces sp. NPDC102405 TaxID=3366170 RepID=UPI00380C4136